MFAEKFHLHNILFEFIFYLGVRAIGSEILNQRRK